MESWREWGLTQEVRAFRPCLGVNGMNSKVIVGKTWRSVGPVGDDEGDVEYQQPNASGDSKAWGPLGKRGKVAAGFGISFLIGWGLILLVYRGAPFFDGFDLDLIFRSAGLPFWMGFEPILKWINGGIFIVDGLPMIMLGASVAMVLSVPFSIWTGRRIGVASGFMAFYWFCSLMVAGLAY